MFDRTSPFFDARRRRRKLSTTLLVVLSWSACVLYEEPGTEVALELITELPDACVDGYCLDELRVSLSAVELLPCEGEVLDEDTLAHRLPRSLGVSKARAAHLDDTPTRWAGGALLSLPGGSRDLAALAPPPLRYCELRITLAELEEDVAESEGAPELVGSTLAATGQVDGEVPWSASTSASAEVWLGLEEPWELEAGAAWRLELKLAPPLPARPDDPESEDAARALLGAVRDGWSVAAIPLDAH